MEQFEIIGGKKLEGTIEVRGSKNAATPILAATLLTEKTCIISNIPLIEDVFRMIEILESMGAKVQWTEKRTISIENKDINPIKLNFKAVKRLRSSLLLLGALSARFNNFKLPYPGGCTIGARPLDTHFDALSKMGIKINQEKEYFFVKSEKRHEAEIILKEFSVTGTENVMMAAALIPGKTVVKIAAAEPHVQDLASFLEKIGVGIEGAGTHTLTIRGKKNLEGAKHRIIPDANEAATFLIMGVATNSPIKVAGAIEEHLDLVLEKLKEFGAGFKVEKNLIEVIPAKKIMAVPKIEARIYPGIPTDVQAPFGILATQANGETFIFDTLYEGRFNYVSELEKMGADTKVLNPHQVLICGPVALKGTVIKSFDLRAGASLIIAALVAKGKTSIHDIYQVDRGYEKIEERLKKLGANIKRVNA